MTTILIIIIAILFTGWIYIYWDRSRVKAQVESLETSNECLRDEVYDWRVKTDRLEEELNLLKEVTRIRSRKAAEAEHIYHPHYPDPPLATATEHIHFSGPPLKSGTDIPAWGDYDGDASSGYSPRGSFAIEDCPESKVFWDDRDLGGSCLFLSKIPPLYPSQARQLHTIIGEYLRGRA